MLLVLPACLDAKEWFGCDCDPPTHPPTCVNHLDAPAAAVQCTRFNLQCTTQVHHDALHAPSHPQAAQQHSLNAHDIQACVGRGGGGGAGGWGTVVPVCMGHAHCHDFQL
jgi:hypothetical protein